MHKREALIIGGVLLLGATAAWALLRSDQPDSGPSAPGDHTPRGPMGGRLLRAGELELEVTIFERGVPPQFRLYPYRAGQPLAPGEVSAYIQLERLGGRQERLACVAEGDFLRGTGVVAEPHSFRFQAEVQYAGQSYRFAYEEIEGRVAMTDATAAASEIEIRTAGHGTIESTLRLPGEIVLIPDRVVRVSPRLPGVVVAVEKHQGEAVAAGELLLVLESRELAAAQARLAAAEETRAAAEAAFRREQELWDRRISAYADYLAAQQALAQADIERSAAQAALAALRLEAEDGRPGRYVVRAPTAGFVLERQVAASETVTAEQVCFVLADVAQVWAEVAVFADDLARVRPGQSVTLTCPALDCAVAGTVSAVGAVIHEATRSAKARVLLDNADGHWRPGLFVTVELTTERREVPVTVALDALQSWRERPAVFVRYGQEFEVRPVEVGASGAGLVEIVHGLQAGEAYAARNSFVIKSELEKSGAGHDH